MASFRFLSLTQRLRFGGHLPKIPSMRRDARKPSLVSASGHLSKIQFLPVDNEGPFPSVSIGGVDRLNVDFIVACHWATMTANPRRLQAGRSLQSLLTDSGPVEGDVGPGPRQSGG